MEHRIKLVRGVQEYPHSVIISKSSDSSLSVIIEKTNIDIDVLATFQYEHDKAQTTFIPLVDESTGDAITKAIPAATAKVGKMLKDVFAGFIKIVFTNTTVGAAKATVGTEVTSNINQLGFDVAAIVDPKLSETVVSFEYGLDVNYGNEVPAAESPVAGNAGATAVSGVIINLIPETVYHWRVKMVNSVGTSYGSDQAPITTIAVVAPTISAEAETLAPTTCEVTATVNANGGATTVKVQYGIDNTYGTEIDCAESPLAAGVVDESVSVLIPDLDPATVYHYRVVAINSAGTTNGSDQTFTTTNVPVIAAEASTPAATTCAIAATVNPGGLETIVKVQVGLTTAYGTDVNCTESPLAVGHTAANVSASLTDLTAETTYHYRLVATNAEGTVNGPDKTFVTTA